MANIYHKARFNQLSKLVRSTTGFMGNYSDRSQIAVMMVIAHESYKGTLREQIISMDFKKDLQYKNNKNNDYGRGIGQKEKFTHDDLWVHSDNIYEDYYRVFGIEAKDDYTEVDRCVYDDKYAIFMIRKKLHMIIEPIPSDLNDIAEYLVKYYNAGGKAGASEYLNDYLEWKG